jgi:zinc transport system substrate-binding protein
MGIILINCYAARMNLRRTPLVIAITLVLALASAASCSSTDSSSDSAASATPQVAVAFYPIQEIVDSVAGDTVRVNDLTPPGQSPHDYELTPRQVAELSNAKAVFYLGQGFQPQLEAAVKKLDDSVLKVDLLDSVDLLPVVEQLPGTSGETDGEVLSSGMDPHIWVSPNNMAAMTNTVSETLKKILPEDSASFTSAASAYESKMTELADSFRGGLTTCESRTIVTSHRAFAYLAADYGLTQVSIAGITPEIEPDPQTLIAVAEKAKADNVTTIFFENNLPPRLSETIAREIGADTDVLDPIESVTEEQLSAGDTYSSIQQGNLSSLQKGLRCA